jgi:hypothetical protein
MNDARRNDSQPFHRWSPFGLLPQLVWPAWASPRLPDHFRQLHGTAKAAPAVSNLDSGKIVDLEDYRQRRLAKLNAVPLRNPAALCNDR